MRFELSVGGVDGETGYLFTSPRVDRVLAFLRTVDHEGSTVTLTVRADDEAAYKLLALIAALPA